MHGFPRDGRDGRTDAPGQVRATQEESTPGAKLFLLKIQPQKALQRQRGEQALRQERELAAKRERAEQERHRQEWHDTLRRQKNANVNASASRAAARAQADAGTVVGGGGAQTPRAGRAGPTPRSAARRARTVGVRATAFVGAGRQAPAEEARLAALRKQRVVEAEQERLEHERLQQEWEPEAMLLRQRADEERLRVEKEEAERERKEQRL